MKDQSQDEKDLKKKLRIDRLGQYNIRLKLQFFIFYWSLLLSFCWTAEFFVLFFMEASIRLLVSRLSNKDWNKERTCRDVKKLKKIKTPCKEVKNEVKKEKADSWRKASIIVKMKTPPVTENILREMIT